MTNQDRPTKSMSESKCYKNRQVPPQDTNHHHTMFGGASMANTDEIAAITVMKHAGAQVATASTGSVDFLKPTKTGDILQYATMVSYTGASSMEVVVQIRIDNIFNNKHDLAALSYLTLVALDDEGKPKHVLGVYPEDDVEKWFHDTAPQRVEQRKARRIESKQAIEYLAQVQHIRD